MLRLKDITFADINQVDDFRTEFASEIALAEAVVAKVPSVDMAEFWGCRAFAKIIGYDANDEIVAEYELTVASDGDLVLITDDEPDPCLVRIPV